MEPTNYWIYRTSVLYWHNQPVQAVLIDPSTGKKIRSPNTPTMHSSFQLESYGKFPDLTFRINPKHPHPDNYVDSTGFTVYSERLINLLKPFNIKSEIFPIRLVDNQGNELLNLKYYIFHSMEGVLPAMDEEKSEWKGDRNVGIPRLVLDVTKIPLRPIFLCNNLYLPLMREDVKATLQKEKITGFNYLRLENYHSGEYGMVMDYDES